MTAMWWMNLLLATESANTLW